jgi:hypothetical protein
MSDTAYPVLQHYGTHAERLAFTPSPASGTQPIYVWYETDTNNAYIYTTAWHGPVNASLPSLSKGGLVTNDGSSNVAIGVGTDGYVLTADSAQTDGIKWAASAGGSGGLVLLEQHTASSSSSLDFTTAITSTYDDYMIDFINILPATDADQLYLRFSTNGGSSYISTGYLWCHQFNYGAATNNWENSTSASGISIGGGSVANSGAGVCGSLRLYNPGASGTTFKSCTMDTTRYNSTLTAIVQDCPSRGQLSVGAVNALRFLFNAGNIASGTIRMYGIVKS